MIYMLDTDMFIMMIRGLKASARKKHLHERAERVAAACLKHGTAGDTLALSAITRSELEFGARASADYDEELQAIELILKTFAVYDYDAINCVAQYGLIRYQLTKSGQPIGSLDTLIAAHAKALSAVLVTNNTKHYSKVKGLKVENWAV
jgi:tRNA(fMet)-specific endonuclease VapC